MLDLQKPPLSATRISEKLFNAGLEYDCVYLLIDRFTDYPLQETIENLPDASALCWPLLDELFKDNPSQSPLLVKLLRNNPAHQSLLFDSIALAQKQSASSVRSICAWLYTNSEPKQLQRALTLRLNGRWPANKSIYLRYFDPRVTPRLLDILPRHQQAIHLGPVQTWCHLGRDGQWMAHVAPFIASPHSYCDFGVVNDWAQAIDRIELINLTAAQLAEQQGYPVPHSQDDAIDVAVQAAHQLGIQDPDDVVAYAWRAVLYKDIFTAHPALPEQINTSIASGLPLDALLAQKLSLRTI